MEHDDFNYVKVDEYWYLGKKDTSAANCLVNPENAENVILPRYHEGKLVYGTRYRCFFKVSTLKTVFIPNTYRVINSDFCHTATNVVSITFEDNSQVEEIGSYFALSTSIEEIHFPASIKKFFPSKTLYCSTLKRVYFASMLKVDYCSNLFMSGIDVKIFVPVNYKYDTFSDKAVTKILKPETRRCTVNMKRRTMSSTIFLIPMFYLS